MTCLKCGGPHPSSACPRKQEEAKTTSPAAEAPFVCYTEAEDTGQEAYNISQGLTTSDAVRQGKAVLDGGATKTFNSVEALERIMNLNQANHGKTGLAGLDLADRPTFGFGNSSRDRCVSTAQLSVLANGREGELRVHALDKGTGPLLFSVESLRSLGALIDFEKDLVCFRKLTDRRVIHLERSEAGHQLLPMTEDWYSKASDTSAPVPSLAEFI